MTVHLACAHARHCSLSFAASPVRNFRRLVGATLVVALGRRQAPGLPLRVFRLWVSCCSCGCCPVSWGFLPFPSRWLLAFKFRQQRLGLFQIPSVKPLGEPTVDLGQHLAGLFLLA